MATTPKIEMSITALAPSASTVAEYFNEVLHGLVEIPYDKRVEITQEMTAIWLKGQMEAVVERTRQGDTGPLRIALEGVPPWFSTAFYEGGKGTVPFEDRKDD